MKTTSEERLAIGIDFGGTTIKCVVVGDGKIVRRGEIIDTKTCGDADAIINALTNEVQRLKSPGVCAVGAGLPGFVDSINGVVHELSNVSGWKNVPLRYLLRERTEMTVAIENDANAMTYAEWKFGAGRNHMNVVCVTLGTGVGGGLILNGELYRGSQLGAGELGQMSIDFRGVPGHYGNLGALEKYVGNMQIAERAQKLYAAAGRAATASECTPAALAGAANGGDAIARGLWRDIGTEIGAALVNVLWLLNPDAIVIGGGIANAGALLFESIRQTVETRTSPVFHGHLDIVPAELGNDAGIIGSATIALDLNKRL